MMSDETLRGALREVHRAPIQGGRIQILPPAEARRIAAGEVVDRPAALVREFMDNAIDAGASLIETTVEAGGIRLAEVSDDGGGMGREDLALCWQDHATSKIRSLADLDTSETLGFRGEALAAAAAVSRLEILSSRDGREAWLLETGPDNGESRITQARRVKGTTVRARGLFDTVPARKRFLKREASEALLCRQTFIEKALPFPGTGFRYVQEGELKLYLPVAASLRERFAAALLDSREAGLLHELSAGGPGFSLVIVAGGPELFRKDRRQQYVFANGRRIQDFSFLQALEYGLSGWFPNGSHPLGAVYLDIDPALADFNIHPAKREARFKDAGAIHHAISSALGSFARHWAGAPLGDALQGDALQRDAPRSAPEGRLAMEALLDHGPDFAPLPGRPLEAAPWGAAPAADSPGRSWSNLAVRDHAPPSYEAPSVGGVPVCGAPHYVGRAFDLFILIERGDRLYMIDQHAAHERLLYDRFLSGPVPRQELLAPIPFSTESEGDDRFLAAHREEFAGMGVLITGSEGSWQIEALPAGWRLPDVDTVRAILDLRTAGGNFARRWAASMACHSAVRDGSYLDETTALALGEAALALPEPRCPHGRPVWWELSREDLFRAVRRIEPSGPPLP